MIPCNDVYRSDTGQCPSPGIPLVHEHPSDFTDLHSKRDFPVVERFVDVVCPCDSVSRQERGEDERKLRV